MVLEEFRKYLSLYRIIHFTRSCDYETKLTNKLSLEIASRVDQKILADLKSPKVKFEMSTEEIRKHIARYLRWRHNHYPYTDIPFIVINMHVTNPTG
jgi:hypothetical protein